MDYIKEEIKLRTESLKFYFIALAGLIAGTSSIFLKVVFSSVQLTFILLGALAILIVLILVRREQKRIRALILQLKNNQP